MTRLRPAPLLCLLLLLFIGHAGLAQAGLKLLPTGSSSRPNFLPAEQAFGLDSEPSHDGLTLHFHITQGYYLYRDRFHFEAVSPGVALKSGFARDGDWKDDPSFGKVQVYHEDIDVDLMVRGSGKVKVVWQGCAEAGLCYPPQSRVIDISGPPMPRRTENVGQPNEVSLADGEPNDSGTSTAEPAVSAASAPAPAAAAASSPAFTAMQPIPEPAPPPPEQARPTTTSPPAAPLPGLFHTSNRGLILLGLLGLGIGLAFTPCMLPMLPILSGIIARQHTRSALRGFLLSLAYVVGMATTYALSGLLVGQFGASANLPAWFQYPPVLMAFSALFVALALSMFGLYDLQMPQALQSRFDAISREAGSGQYLSSFVMGFFAALVVSPCVSAPLAGVLLYISTTGDAAFGALCMFAVGIGMGLPLLLLGATESSLLPKAGEWMERIKVLLGLMLLAVAVLLLGRILPGPVTLLLWAALSTVTAVWLGALEPVKPGIGHLWKGLGVLFLIYSAVLVVGAATGNDDPLMPLQRFGSGSQASSPAVSFRKIKSSAELDAALQEAAASHQTVLLDFYADWCVSCKLMERNVFTQAPIASLMNADLLLQADVTANDDDDHALLNRFGLAGPPAILFFRDNQEMFNERVVGEMNGAEFLQRLQAVKAGN